MITQGFGGGLEKMIEKLAAFAENTAQHLGHGKDELPVCNGLAESLGDPTAGAQDAALVAGGAEVAVFAGEGEEPLVAAIGVGADEPGEPRREIAALEKIFDSVDGGRA